MMKRPSERAYDGMRDVELTPDVSPYAEGSCMVKFGNTHVLCTATLESGVPSFLRDTGQGWITAEYGMLPRATKERMSREASRGKQSGRTLEIQRLIGRSLRAVTDLRALGERQVRIDCDVIQADGGTRTASITGAYVALYRALSKLVKGGALAKMPLIDWMAAISCGVYQNMPVLDLDYVEDKNAEADANFVLTGQGNLIEIQATAETKPLSQDHYDQMYVLAQKGIGELITLQKNALNWTEA